MSVLTHEYLTFILDNEEYAVNILAVQEIRIWSAVTDIPNTPDYIKGVINLRGVVIPIVDLRQRFSKEPVEYNGNTVVIILKEVINHKSVIVGVVVDAVSDVYNFADNEIKSMPDFGSQIDSRFLRGMATDNEKTIVIIDALKLLDIEQLYKLSSALNKAAS